MSWNEDGPRKGETLCFPINSGNNTTIDATWAWGGYG